MPRLRYGVRRSPRVPRGRASAPRSRKQLENPRVEFQIAGVGSPGTASSVYVIEIVQDGQVVVRTKRSFGDPDSTLTPHGSTPRTAASLKDVGLTDIIKAAIDEYVQHGG
jgi:hypothetical protein